MNNAIDTPLHSPSALVIFAISIVAMAVLLALAGRFDAGVRVTRDQLGSAWPLTISEGALRCEHGREITFQSGGTTYSLRPPVKHGAYSDLGALRANDPNGAKMDLSPLIERGTRLCP